ncbi:toxin-antitoxin system YwqK family antitoxin [Empedobacter brevis]
MKFSLFVLCLIIVASCSTKIRKELPEGEYEIEHFKNDSVKHGKSIIYFKNGLVQRVIKYRNNVMSGTMRFYHNNGNLASKTKFENGIVKGKFYNYHLNGKPYNTYIYHKNKLIGIENCFDGFGKELNCGSLNVGRGTINQYNLNGKLIAIDYIENGVYLKTDSIK